MMDKQKTLNKVEQLVSKLQALGAQLKETDQDDKFCVEAYNLAIQIRAEIRKA